MGVSFSDINRGTAVGFNGTILRTTNGGTTWGLQNSGTTVSLRGVWFSDANNGTAVGFSGTILRTTNGGVDWVMQNSGTTTALRGVVFSDVSNGTVVGDNGTILRTTNGGATWTPQNSGTTGRLLSVSFIGPNLGTVTGENGIILRTTNGGTTWTPQTAGVSAELRSVSFSSINNGMIVGDRWTGSQIACVILNTTNGGSTWTIQENGLTDNLYAVCMPDELTAVAVGYGGTVLRTETGGLVSVADPYVISDNQSSISLQVAPDPFCQSTTLCWYAPENGRTILQVFSLSGMSVKTLIDDFRPAGRHRAVFEAENLTPGVYVCCLTVNGKSFSRLMVLTR
jgi:photosystem II stability/assembly factor-like uncharacterized protein